MCNSAGALQKQWLLIECDNSKCLRPFAECEPESIYATTIDIINSMCAEFQCVA